MTKEWGLIEPVNEKASKPKQEWLNKLTPSPPRKKKEVLTKTEKILLGSIFDAYKKQYRKKSPLRYSTAVALEEKLVRLKLVEGK